MDQHSIHVHLEKFNLVQKIRIKDDKRFSETSYNEETLAHLVTVKEPKDKKEEKTEETSDRETESK
jgi:hypothetical protein